MPQAQGSSTELAMGIESSFGVTGATAKIYPYIPTFTLNETQNLVDSNVIRNTRDMAEPTGGFINATSSFSVPFDSDLAPVWLYLAMGSVTTVDDLDTTYTHTIKKHDTTLPSIFIDKRHTDITKFHLGNGFRVNGFNVDFSGEGEAQLDIDLVGKSVIPDTAEAVTPTTAVEGNYFGKFQGDVTGLGCVTAFTMAYTNNLQTDSRCISSTAGGRISDIPLGLIGISGSFTIQFTDTSTTEADARALTTVSLTTSLTNGTDIITFEIEEAKLTATDNGSVDSPQGLSQTYDYTAFWKAGSNNSALAIVVENSVATVSP